MIASITICKYFNSPTIFLLIVVLASILYQGNKNKKKNETDNFEESLINISKFIIFTGIPGYIVVRIVGFFFPGFN
jgi:hypothetical protein